MQQLGYLWPEQELLHHRYLRKFLDQLLARLSELLGEKKLHLDHDPPLGVRQRKGEGKNTVYEPDANDPNHLFYRGKIAHDIKTRIRGENGQYSDLTLIKRERRRTKKKTRKAKRKWPARKLQSANRWPKRGEYNGHKG